MTRYWTTSCFVISPYHKNLIIWGSSIHVWIIVSWSNPCWSWTFNLGELIPSYINISVSNLSFTCVINLSSSWVFRIRRYMISTIRVLSSTKNCCFAKILICSLTISWWINTCAKVTTQTNLILIKTWIYHWGFQSPCTSCLQEIWST